MSLPKKLRVDFLSVGQGDSFFIETPVNNKILIDGGPDSSVLSNLAEKMPFWDREIDLVILTHPDSDHMTGLIDVLEKYKVDEIYSTDYTRTKETIAPFANKINKPIQLYDPKTISAFTEQLRNENKTIVVIGHSNTTPALVNLLVKENKFKTLDDNEYGTYWIVKIKDGKAEAEEMKY